MKTNWAGRAGVLIGWIVLTFLSLMAIAYTLEIFDEFAENDDDALAMLLLDIAIWLLIGFSIGINHKFSIGNGKDYKITNGIILIFLGLVGGIFILISKPAKAEPKKLSFADKVRVEELKQGLSVNRFKLGEFELMQANLKKENASEFSIKNVANEIKSLNKDILEIIAELRMINEKRLPKIDKNNETKSLKVDDSKNVKTFEYNTKVEVKQVEAGNEIKTTDYQVEVNFDKGIVGELKPMDAQTIRNSANIEEIYNSNKK